MELEQPGQGQELRTVCGGRHLVVTVQFACHEAGQCHTRVLLLVQLATVQGAWALQGQAGHSPWRTRAKERGPSEVHSDIRVVHARKRLITQPGGIPIVPNTLLKEE